MIHTLKPMHVEIDVPLPWWQRWRALFKGRVIVNHYSVTTIDTAQDPQRVENNHHIWAKGRPMPTEKHGSFNCQTGEYTKAT